MLFSIRQNLSRECWRAPKTSGTVSTSRPGPTTASSSPTASSSSWGQSCVRDRFRECLSLMFRTWTQQVRLVRVARGAEPGGVPEPDREAAEGVAAAAVLLDQDDAGGGRVRPCGTHRWEKGFSYANNLGSRNSFLDVLLFRRLPFPILVLHGFTQGSINFTQGVLIELPGKIYPKTRFSQRLLIIYPRTGYYPTNDLWCIFTLVFSTQAASSTPRRAKGSRIPATSASQRTQWRQQKKSTQR